MPGMNLHTLAPAFVQLLYQESRRSAFARRHHHTGLRRRHRRFFASNHGRRGTQRRDVRRGARPLRRPATVVHHARPSNPAVTVNHAAFTTPPMEWILGGSVAPILGEDFIDELAAPPPPPYCPVHGYGQCPARTAAPPPPQRLSTLTPSDDLPEYFPPPGYAPVPDLLSPPLEAKVEGPSTPPRLGLDINFPGDAGNEPTAPAASAAPSMAADLPTPSPEARRILRRFAAAMEQHITNLRGAWAPDTISFTGDGTTSSSNAGSGVAQGPPRLP